jgi:flagellar hook protein FlgE
MSITSSFYSGLSGLDTHATAMQVIGDNIANVHTTGFKSSSAHFEDVLGVSLTGVAGSNQTGAGASVEAVDVNFIQGSLETTDVGTDVAINGKGFFILKNALSGEDVYTRAGHFTLDNQGYYVNSQGYRVQGYQYDPSGTALLESLGDIQVNPNNMLPPHITSEVSMGLNLDAASELKTFDIADPPGTSNYSTALTVFDSLGESHQVQVYFNETAPMNWEWHAVIDGGEVGGTAGTPELYGSGSLVFDGDGKLTTVMPVSLYDSTLALTFASGTTPPDTTIDFTDTTQYGSPSAIQKITQDGYAAGNVTGISVDESGNLLSHYTNGTVKSVARLVLADFPNLNGLEREGGNLYRATTKSGDPLNNKPGEGGVGTISSSMLEESNVDLASEFIKMIIIQRGYQANTKVITTTDDMLAQLINIR